jgi:hypothetical protein
MEQSERRESGGLGPPRSHEALVGVGELDDRKELSEGVVGLVGGRQAGEFD